MSNKDDDDLYDDDVDMLEFNEKLPNTEARATMEDNFDEEHVSPLMFGPTGRGSPEMELRPEHMLFRDAAQARRIEGIKDDKYMKYPINLEPINEQQKKEAKDAKMFDEYLDKMYKEMKKPVKSAVRPMSNAKLPPKKGGTRKRTRARGSRRNKRSSRRRSKRSRSRSRSRR